MELSNLHHWDVLAISCIDGRFIKRTVDYVAEKTDAVFDFRTEVGCTKAFIDCPNDCERVDNVIATSKRLHNIKEVWIFDHIDCGAYGGSKEFENAEAEKAFHAEQLNKVKKHIESTFPDLKARLFWVDWEKVSEI